MAEVLAAPEERGSLDIRLKAVERAAELAALRTPGTIAQSGVLGTTAPLAAPLAAPLGRLGGARYPRASVTLRAGRARVVVDVAVPWPSPTAHVATEVRETVRAETRRITGIEIRSVDVTVHLVAAGDVNEERRRVR